MTKVSGDDIIGRAAIGIVPEELTEENYEEWKRCLEHYLVGHGLWGVVSGEEQDPINDERQEYGEEKKQEHEEWRKKNALALHAIQLSCGPGTYVKLKEAHTSAEVAWKHLVEKLKPNKILAEGDPEDESSCVEEEGGKHSAIAGPKEYLHYAPLYIAIEKGDLHLTKSLLDQDPDAVRAIISSHGETALHFAILNGHMKIAKELLRRMEQADLEMVNDYGCTALTLAAISGEKKLARAIVNKNDSLLSRENELDDGQLPVIVAALYGQKHMVNYLYSVTPKGQLHPEVGKNGATLLNSLITAEVYDVASMLLQQYPKLGVTPDHNGDYALKLLAHKPSAFPSGTKLVFWKRWIYSCLMEHSPWGSPTDSAGDEIANTKKASMIGDHSIEIHHSSDGEKNLTGNQGLWITSCVLKVLHGLGWSILRCLGLCHDRKLIHKDAIQLLTCIFKEIETLSMKELEEMDIDKILYDAIEHGIVEFVEKTFKFRTGIIYKRDKKGRTIFSHAIVLRQEKIYSLIYALGTRKSILARRHDFFQNNFLHLAAKLSPSSQLDKVSGAALQMQRELQWFKEVESIVQPRMKEELNASNKTPSALFSEEHKVLAKEGERWMKNTAGSSMIVGTLIAAVMFTTAFTVPGGNDSKTGLPVMLETQSRVFLIFMASNALSMFTSSTSILMFLGILTARYAEGDFLKSLPTKLIFGITCLFVSIVTMMASFGTALYLMLIEQVAWISYPIIAFSVIPIALYSLLQFPLLVEMIGRTYGHGIFDKPKKKLDSFET
ncbi:uncharacterized protein LOC113777776 [Coffea eugenioides]|uniref:Uncharacterized protein isoform X2 n=1 Tax=Coffea arabica TaxID=13443 RepID=A0ABM4V8R6_COFAR|nr:uncharacterized protein LOC113777776 [Coffea eugenioides]